MFDNLRSVEGEIGSVGKSGSERGDNRMTILAILLVLYNFGLFSCICTTFGITTTLVSLAFTRSLFHIRFCAVRLAILFFLIFFTYFYVAITFNPDEVADNMKKYGGFIPGIRAGRPTSEYLQYVLSRITAPGALYLALVAIIPIGALIVFGATQNFPFGGTAILIVVGVGLDTAKQIESQLQQRSYEGFLR